ncbi:MAG: hypothetical protein J3T61_12420 [Candidatus Brocadiales bacterium]|nr:hypothetical protein [Candidatus Bathyanammoxibius sp.]
MFEIIRKVCDLPEDGKTIMFDWTDAVLGGGTYNLGWYLSHLGLSPILVAALSQEKEDLIIKAFKDANLRHTSLKPVEGAADNLIAFSDNRTHRSYFVKSKLPENFADRIVKSVDTGIFVFSGSRHREVQCAYMKLLQNSAAEMTVFAPSYTIYETGVDLVRKLVEKSDLVAINQREAEYVRCKFEASDMGALAGRISGSLLVTLAGNGAELWRGGKRVFIHSYTDTTDDVIGAGDAFLAGLLYVCAHRGELIDACHVGAVLASFVVEKRNVRVSVSLDNLTHKASELADNDRRAIDALESFKSASA